MKIFIVFEILNQPTGGGNQFLKMLKKQFDSMSLLTSEPSEADIFLFNSHHFLQNVASYKKSFPKAKFIHRIDGPMRLYNDLSDPRDQQVYFANETFADATIYQSEWSKDKNLYTKLCERDSDPIELDELAKENLLPLVKNWKKGHNW